MKLNLDTTQLRKFGDNLIKIKTITFPQIMNNLITTTTYDLSNTLKKETIPRTFTRRNNFAPMSIRYNRAIGYNMNTMFAMVGQIANAGSNNAKTILEENELGKPIESKTKHTVVGLKSIRAGNSFNKTIKKENRLSNLKPVPAQHILRNFRYQDQDNKPLEFGRLVGLIASNRIRTLNKPVIAWTKTAGIGIYDIKNDGDKKVKVKKLYTFSDKTTKIKKREWLRTTYEDKLKNLDQMFSKVAKKLMDQNANAFHIAIRNT